MWQDIKIGRLEAYFPTLKSLCCTSKLKPAVSNFRREREREGGGERERERGGSGGRERRYPSLGFKVECMANAAGHCKAQE